jgi:DNA-binding MltR family transcriptional regulator
MAKRESFKIDVDEFNARLREETDRACAILGAAMLDARLESLFRSRLIGQPDELLANGRPLGSFSVKIRLSHSLGWISDDACKDLNIVREVRNRFAHSFDHDLTFDDQSIRDQCSNLGR